MTKMKQSFILKLIAVILFAAFLTTALFFAAGLYILIDNNMFSQKNTSFFSSKACESITHSYSENIYSSYLNYFNSSPGIKPHIIEEIKYRYNSDNCNLSFVIKDSNGNVVLSNYEDPNYSYRKEYVYTDSWYSKNTIESGTEKFETYTITCSVRSALTANDDFYNANYWFEILYPARYLCIIFTSVGIFIALVMIVYLISAAGHCKGKDGITLNAADRIPYDLYIAMITLALFFSGHLIGEIDLPHNLIILSAPVLFIDSLLFLSVIMTFSARYKAGHWWKNTVVYYICAFFRKLIVGICKAIAAFFRNLSVLWKVLLIYGGITVIEFFIIVMIFESRGSAGVFVIWILEKVVLCGLICWITLHLKKLKDGAEKISEGDFSYKIDTEKMMYDLKKHGENLNSINSGISKALEERLKSERLKTELITNVSHDIKTPLTSIINYVDLLKKENIDNEAAKEYIGVLDRQSARLKKMTEDLVEASKASTGNISVSPVRTDIKELLSQAVGEYDERLKGCSLEPVITLPESELPVYCDGRLLWRVFDNLLGNICKYSQPLTRVYFSAYERDGKIEISFKNISKYPLNISGDELTERFVRGDSSRSTEGSGLGLSIAKSLTELQKGKLDLFIDGDLFKALIIFDKMK